MRRPEQSLQISVASFLRVALRPPTRINARASGRSLAERLDHFSIPEPNSGCRLWTGAASAGRYGGLRWGGRMVRAHRLAWENKNGPIPPGAEVCHRCDVTFCINPDHLFLGTHADNMRDRRGKGRYGNAAAGRANGNSVATEEAVRAIRASSQTTAALARETGLSESTVRHIRQGRTWTHVA